VSGRRDWQPRLTADAKRDFDDIIRWTNRKFGRVQAATYQEIILSGLERLKFGPEIAGTRDRSDLAPGLRTISVARRGRSASHILLYRARNGMIIDVLRILHKNMDVARHVPPDAASGVPVEH